MFLSQMNDLEKVLKEMLEENNKQFAEMEKEENESTRLLFGSYYAKQEWYWCKLERIKLYELLNQVRNWEHCMALADECVCLTKD